MSEPAKIPAPVTQRIAVVLGVNLSGQLLLNFLQPLLGRDGETNLHCVFIEDDELQQAVALPFVKELCRLTLSVREIHNAQFDHIIALRMRTARKAVAGLARLMGVSHTFDQVRGSTVSLLREAVDAADITVFEPLRKLSATPVKQPVHARRTQQRIVVMLNDPVAGVKALVAAALLAEGDSQRMSILLSSAKRVELNALEHMIDELLPGGRARVLVLTGPGIPSLIAAANAERGDILVLGASEEMLKPESLRTFLKQLQCPVCLVR